MPDTMSKYISTSSSEKMSEYISDRRPENIPHRMPEYMLDRVSKSIAERLPEYMPDRA